MTLPPPDIARYVLGPAASWADVVRAVLDVAVVGWVLFRGLLLLRGTRGIQVLVGLFLLGLAYLGAQWVNLPTVTWLLGHFLSYSFIFGVIVLFQADIRRGLAHLGRGGFAWALAPDGPRAQAGASAAVARAAAELARRRRGALVVLERVADLGEVIETGIRLDASLTPELLLSIFHPGGALHDGAVVIQGGRVAAAGCLLPLTSVPQTHELGTRHRAALGLADEVDAVVVVVSEERGEVSVAVDGELHRGLDEAQLRQLLARLLTPRRRGERGTRHDRAAWEPTPTPPPSGRPPGPGQPTPEDDRAAV